MTLYSRFRARSELTRITHLCCRFASQLAANPAPTAYIPEKRRTGLLARKVGMMNMWDAGGMRYPVTVLCVDRCHVLQVKEPQPTDRRERWALQVGAGPKRPYKTHKSARYHCAKAGVEPKQKIVEFLVAEDAILPVGSELRASYFIPGQFVDVTGTSIGKGFQGPMKRWGFKGGNASHGNSKAHRSHGSTGMSTSPGRTFPGKKMAGRMGGDRITVQSIRILRIDEDRNLIFVKGAVPGNSGNWVRVRDAVKKKFPKKPEDVETTARESSAWTFAGVRDWEGLHKVSAASS